MSLRHFFRRPETVTAAEAASLVTGGSAIILDVRRTADWQRNHIPGAMHIPLDALAIRAEELPDGYRIITFCTGGLLSSGAANLLVELGFDAVNMAGGLIDWRSSGGSLTSTA